MIVKKIFNPVRIWRHIYREVCAAAAMGTAVAVVHGWQPDLVPAVPFVAVGVLGSALAIFLAFRNNAAYGRWWEARSQWAALLNASRIFGRQIEACTAAQELAGQVEAGTAAAFRREMLLRQVAIAYALRGQLRGTDETAELARLLATDEAQSLQSFTHPPVHLLRRQGLRIKEGMAGGLLGSFDAIVLEPPLSACNAALATCEKLADTPLPRQYAFFTRALVWLFIGPLPVGLLGVLPEGSTISLIGLTVLVAGAFTTLDRTGQALEEPFANRVTDVPLSYVCAVLERDVRESLGERGSPAVPDGASGYLW